MQKDFRTLHLNSTGFPERLRHMHDPPRQLFVRGHDLELLLAMPTVAIVGSRKVTAYGRTVTMQLARELARAGIVIVSGLAIGVDGVAHRAALDAGGSCIAVLPCGLEQIYPASHRELAERIVASGGALVSEYPPGAATYKLNFIARNRIVAGLSDAVLITEAAMRSGTLHTARFALEQGKELLAIPGNIISETSVGANALLQTGASLVTKTADVLHALSLEEVAQNKGPTPRGGTPEEQLILNFLTSGMHDGAELLAATGLDVATFNHHLTMLELAGVVRALGANHWAVG